MAKTIRKFLFNNAAVAELLDDEFKIDVPVTGAAVQSSLDDDTSGVLLLAGAFGLGGGARTVTDLTTQIPCGFVRWAGATVTGGPDSQSYTYVGFVADIDPSAGALVICGRVTGNAANQAVFVGSRLTATGTLQWRQITLV